MLLSKHIATLGIALCIIGAYLIYMYYNGGDGYILSLVLSSLVALLVGEEALIKINKYKKQIDTLSHTVSDLLNKIGDFRNKGR